MKNNIWIEVVDKAEGFKEIIDGVISLEMTEYRVVDLENYEVFDLDDYDLSQLRDLVTDKNIKLFQKVVDKFEE